MALEKLTLTTTPPVDGEADGGGDYRPASLDGGEDGGRVARLPRWTRQEILVLIQGKRVAESRVRRGRNVNSSPGSAQTESKWASVSSYCKRHGVNRGPVQCRKRWSNLAGDYRKIKEWESKVRDETESFWVMRNDLRRERKLPGFFDREVYEILDKGLDSVGAEVTQTGLALALAPPREAVAMEEGEEAAIFDSGRSAAPEDGLFSDFEQEDGGGGGEKEVPPAVPVATAVPISEKQCPSGFGGREGQGVINEEQPASNPEIGSTSQEGRKRKREVNEEEEETTGLQYHLLDALEKNGKLLIAQLETQNNNFQLEREQRKNQADGLLAVLNKLADAVVRIAEKL